jgi:hypothetical protein
MHRMFDMGYWSLGMNVQDEIWWQICDCVHRENSRVESNIVVTEYNTLGVCKW